MTRRSPSSIISPLALLLFTPQLHAHNTSDRFLRHNITAAVSSANIDIEIDLTFYGARALAERQAMDHNENGLLSGDETSAHLANLSDSYKNQFLLTIDGAPQPLAPLYTPEADLLEVDTVTPSPCIFRFYYFARTPRTLQPGTRVEIVDRIRPDIPALHTFDVTGSQGVELQPERELDAFAAAEDAVSDSAFTAICTAIPPMENSGDDETPNIQHNDAASPWIILGALACAAAILGVIQFRRAARRRREI